jgi:hypothetical protein
LLIDVKERLIKLKSKGWDTLLEQVAFLVENNPIPNLFLKFVLISPLGMKIVSFQYMDALMRSE